MEIQFKHEAKYLGALIGNQNSKRIIALSTSDVFIDKSLISNFWNIDASGIDNGLQAHLYTRENDILVVRVPSVHSSVVEKVSIVIKENHDIWNSLAGVSILSHEKHIVLTSNHSLPASISLPKNFSWYQGELLDVAASLFKQGGHSILAFVFNEQVLNALGVYSRLKNDIKNIAQDISLFMDKNITFELFKKGSVDCPKTSLFDKSKSSDFDLNGLFASEHYVFKPAGGAAGIGVYFNNGLKATKKEISDYMIRLKTNDQLPTRFQIQEFIQGTPYGASAYFAGNGKFDILEIHQQIINENGKFTGGRWTPNIVSEQIGFVRKTFSRILTIVSGNFTGLLCIDFIAEKVIEVNPRITAATPIIHLFHLKDQLKKKFGESFSFRQIDINTDLYIPFEIINDGLLTKIIEKIWKHYKVLCLPQGLNPFGVSRMIFINDDINNSGQCAFVKNLQYSR